MIGQTLANRYKLNEELVSDSSGLLYKAQDLHDNRFVLVVALSDKSLSRPLEIQLRFKRAVEQASRLVHPDLLKTIEIIESDNKTYVICEGFDSLPLSSYLAQPQNLNQPWDIDRAVDLILQVSSALSVAHEQNILHQAIQPANILISLSQPQTAKLFNFGFSILKDISKIIEKQDIISTFGYLSPESSGILRKSIDVRSDIYSLGILFYQLLTGRLPYMADDISNLIHQHIATKPTPPSKLNNQVPPVLDNIILRLISKEPTERYQSIQGLVHDLKEYQKQRKEGKVLIDFEIARADRLATLSFSTKLIGRDKELSELNSLLDKTRLGQGSLAFVFGEPGIGKSRLVDELRGSIHSLNGLFCGGKCYQYEFMTPYKVFSEAIDACIEKIKRLSQKEQEVHIQRIKQTLGELGGEVVKIAPGITDLIGAPPKLVALEPEKEKIRFLITVTNFLVSLSSSDSPLLMFLDDLQWADDGSLEVLERFAEKLVNSSVLLIISYRDTEVNETHPLAKLIKNLKDQQVSLCEIPVRFFSPPEITQMVSQVLMEKEEAVVSLTKELGERTQGNPFFILELLHSLVDAKIVYLEGEHYVYDLDKLKDASLPTSIVDAVLKRMKDLSEDAMKILSYASVMGKEIDFDILGELANISSDQILSSIENGIQNQVLYRDLTGRENVFFMHDRIREAFYQRVSQEERLPLHRRIAEVLEGENKVNPQPVLYELAYHFTEGKVEDKALQYCIPAAHKAQSSYARDLAITLYLTAKNILEKQKKEHDPVYLEVLENLGEVYRLAGKFDDSLSVLRRGESLIPKQDIIHRAEMLSKIGDTVYEKGDLEGSAKTLVVALEILGVRIPHTFAGLGLGIMKEFFIQQLHAWYPGIFLSKVYNASKGQAIILKILNRIGHIYYFIDINKMFYLFLRALNFGERLGPSAELTYSYIDGGPVWSSFPWSARAFRDNMKGLKMAQDLGDKRKMGAAYAYLALASYIANKPKEGLEYARQSVTILKEAGEYWEMGAACIFRDLMHLISGKSIDECMTENNEFVRSTKEINALQGYEWSLLTQTAIRFVAGTVDDKVIAVIRECHDIAKKTVDKGNIVYSMSYMAFAYLRMGDYDNAIEKIEEAMALFPANYNKASWIMDMFPKGAQIYLDCIVNKPNLLKRDKERYLRRARSFCFQSVYWTFLFKYCYGYSLQVNATYYWITGHKRKAVKTWDKALNWLRTNKNNPGGDKYRIAYILLEEAKFLLSDNPQDKKALGNLLEAKELFSSMGCKLDLKTCNDLLQKIMPSTEGLEGREALTQRRHLESLLSTTRAIGSVFDLDELLNKIMDYAITVTGAERGFLLLYDDKTGQLSLKLSHGFNALESFSFESSRVSLELIHEAEKQKDTLIAS
ncbi:MAG: AAA family ATPase, partial [Candidatus Omnitrophica bacterium]|nr:AAA family ATPase [Candidatus Omnitrophota bacterium]